VNYSARRSAPSPPHVDHVLEAHGDRRVDEYFWLRERSDATLAHLAVENAYTQACLAPLEPLRATLYGEILGHIQQTDLSVPYRLGAYRYYSRTVEGAQYPIYARVAASEPPVPLGVIPPAEEILIDGNVLGTDVPYFSVGALSVSDDGTKLAYTTDTTGYRQYALVVKDLTTGSLLDVRDERVTDVIWSDDVTLFYVTEDDVSKRSDLLWRRRMDADAPVRVFEESHDEYQIGIERSRDRAFVFCVSIAKDTSETRYLSADRPEDDFAVFRPRRDGLRYFVDHRGDAFFIRTDDDAVDFAVASVSDRDPSAPWTTVVPSRADETIESIDCFERFAVLGGRRDGLQSLTLYDYDTHALSPLAFGEDDYVASLGANPEFAIAELRISFQSLLTPSSVLEIDVSGAEPAAGTRTLLKRTDVPGYDPERYVAERVWATAADGTRVPISVVAKLRDGGRYDRIARDGTAPALLYGYGSYGHSIDPTFSPARLALLDRGVVFAIAHVRGGGELGEAWRLAGNLSRKRTTFEDFIACADFLASDGLADPRRIAIQGGSAGGLLLGAVLNMEPERFCGALVQVPFVDVLTTMLDADLPLTTGEYREWGDPNDPAAYAYMKTYSPYDNLAAKPYPPVLVEVSLNDSQVPYWEGAKYAARMRDRTTSSHPVLLKTNLAAGHGGASGRYDYLRDVAFDYAFLLRCFGLA